MRIAKYIAHSGYCSRREAEKLISKNVVKINSIICNNPATKVIDSDIITINKKNVILEKKIRIWIFYKPNGIITTSKDPEGRKTVFDLLPKFFPRVITIGRLDINSEGLLLLTNNGDFARFFELPKNKFYRKYKVRLQGIIDKNKLIKLENGITIDKIKYRPIKANLDKQMKSNAWVTIQLTEGKNREIRKICSHFGWRVNKLIRTGYGIFNIGNLKVGDIKEIKDHPYNDKNYWRKI